MEKLNELVEQAKFVADWHGSDWSSALCQDKHGNQAHEIICESRGEAVISTGSNSNEASWLCDYLELCSPANILAIAEAFRALEQEVQKNLEGALAWQQRAEAAEAKAKNLNDGWLNAIAERDEARLEQGKLEASRIVKDSWKERAWTAEEKLAELEKQKAVGTVSIAMDWNTHRNIATVNMRPDLVVAEMKDGDELFTRPAPAVSLTEMVPEGWKLVPVEPTEEMIAAGDQFMDGLSRLGDAYEAMLAAAPEVENV